MTKEIEVKLKTWMKSALAVGALMTLTSGALPVACCAMLPWANLPALISRWLPLIWQPRLRTICLKVYIRLMRSNAPVPLLASGETVSADGKTIVISLA